ncbi:MAG TPA: hypothetical protein VFG68_12165 [Fimbriiglobus sp.]|nr:hypothetical protein [Fimbriiglobus sp.]
MAARLRQEPGLNVQLVDGNRGEFSVSVNGRQVISKTGDDLPTEDQVLTAVRQAAPAHA